jgi:putative membrane protein
MSRHHLLSSLVAAVLAAAPALLAQTQGQRDTDKTGTSRTQGQRDTDKTGTSRTQEQTDTQSKDRIRSGEQASGTAQLRNNERKFMMDAAQDSHLEIELGKLAQERGSSPAVKEFGERMVEEHTKALDKLKTAASDVNVTIPDELQAKHKATVDRLSKLSGEEFDQAYMKSMVQDHKKAVNLFERTSKNAQNEAVKNYASETSPALREHPELAPKINADVPAKGTASRQKDASRTSPSQRSDDESPTGTKRHRDTKSKPTDTPKEP